MHILLVNPAYKPAWRMGGTVVIVASVAEELVRCGHRVTVMTTNANLDHDLDVPVDRPVDVEGVEVWYFRHVELLKNWLPFVPYLSKSIGFFYAPEMARTLNRIVPSVDVVHTHMPFNYPNYAAARASFAHRKPLVYQQNGILDPKRLRFRSLKKKLYIEAVERPIMRRAAALIAGTEAERESYQRLRIGTPCHLIANGVDVSRYRTVAQRTRYPGWQAGSENEVILFLGRLHPIKGTEKLLRAFLMIQDRYPRAVLVIAGPDEFGIEAGFRSQVQSSGLLGRVFFPGMVEGDEKLDLLARADLFCLPSEAEGFSLTILEALASATPVLLSPGCHFPEVEEVGAGRISNSDPEILSKAMASLLDDPESLRHMGVAARAFVASEYSWESITTRLLALYGSLVTGRARNPDK
jgi:glycosyltransferase involved in cell wall biosynthesis